MKSIQISPRKNLLPIAILGGCLGLSACNTHSPSSPLTPPSNLQGEIVVDGSSTVFPITEAMAEAFRQLHPQVKISGGVSGSGGGFKKFCADQLDIANASRPIKTSEIAACKKKGVEYLELPIAFDALTVVIHPKNTWASCLTVEQLKTMWNPAAAGKITTWQQVDSRFPNQPLVLYGPGQDSGTFDYFTEAINGKVDESRSDYSTSEDDNILVQNVATNPNALGYFGFSYLEANMDKLRAVTIDDGDPSNGKGCMKPSPKTVLDGTYQPLSRPLFIYVKKAALKKPQVKAFIEFYLAGQNHKLIKKAGYIALSPSTNQKVKSRFETQTTGSLFENRPPVGVNLGDLL